MNDQRYDRQLRLWKAHGQKKLENSHILLINADATGTETLKNLVLPGVGAFTILDTHIATELDLQSNFYVRNADVERGPQIMAALLDMNDQVHGECSSEGVDQLLALNSNALTEFTVIIASEVSVKTAVALSKLCKLHDISLVLVRTIGFVGYVRLQLPEHAVVETHTENVKDLRLDAPWPELKELALKLNLQADSMQVAHIPFPLLTIYFVSKLGYPVTVEDKAKFKQAVMNAAPADTENFHEACSNLFRASPGYTLVPQDIKELMNDTCCTNICASNSDFWFMVKGLKKYVEHHGVLPLHGTLPDMKADTEQYVKLQQVYQSKARVDVDEVNGYVTQLCQQHGRNPISLIEVERFCKNCTSLKLLRYSSIADEYDKDPAQSNDWYLAIRAADKFHQKYDRQPGTSLNWQDDVKQLKDLLPKAKEEYLSELARTGNTKLHTVCAYVGGLASQEIIKIITHQYVPVNNTIIYDGMTALSQVISN